MPRTRVAYTPEFRCRLVELARSGRSLSSLVREFEPTVESIRKWVRQADLDERHRDDGLTTVEQQEIRRLRREVRRLVHEDTPSLRPGA